MRIPGFSQGKPLPPGPRHVYGSDETIHQTGKKGKAELKC